MLDPREKIQQEAKQVYLDSNRKNTLILPTGSGKSKVAIDIIKELKPQSILLLTNSQDLRDTNWRVEFEKWDYPWQDIQSECYQTMYTKYGTWDLIIYDEVDFACTEEYGKCFVNLQCKYLLAMTGFITEDKEKFLEQFAPIVFAANIEDLQKDNVLNKSEFILIEYPLSLQKTLEQKGKNGFKFFVSENDQYKYWEKQFQMAMIVKSQIEKKLRLLHQPYENDKAWQAADWKYKIMASKRKKLLHTLESTITVTKNVLEHIHSIPGNKVIIFNALTEQADRLPNPYHGKSDKEISGIGKLNSGEINTLSVVKKVTRGTNLVGVNYLIRATYDGSEVDLNQSHGRLTRLKPGEVAKYIILIPVYLDLVKMQSGRMEYQYLQTQAEKWKNKMMTAFQVNPRIIRLDKDLKIKDGIIL